MTTLPFDHRADPGPFDIIGDVHGRLAWPEVRVRQHMLSLSGSHLDPHILEVFLSSDLSASSGA